ncbi:MAG: PLP-dependent aminotransferase family protein [Blastocatellia bacterium]|nr:PLP-dependent aminotransferase family protein [Blastocatellia bacterium]
MFIELDRESRIPLYTQIVDQVRDMIESGTLGAGDRLPANRELAKALGVNRTTVTTAYAELVADGLVSSEVGRGTFVNDIPVKIKKQADGARTQPSPMPWNALLTEQNRNSWISGVLHQRPGEETISFAYSLPQAELFPLDDFRRSVDRVLRKEGRVLLQLGLSNGYAPLQEYLVSQMALSGIRANADEVLITNGCQQSLDLIRRILVGPGDEIAIENPTYPGALSVFCGGTNKFVSVPVGERGMDLDVLEDVLSQRRIKLIYTIPSFHNPTGATMDTEARRRLIELAARHRVPVVEDDIYREMRYEGAALPSLKALDRYGLVIYINSFSKVGFPGLRVGWIAAPPVVISHLNRAKEEIDLHASLLTQAAIYEFSRRGLLAKHIKRVKKVYAQHRDIMLEALERYFPEEAAWDKPEGGMAVWVRLPERLSADQILVRSAEQGVIFSPGHYFYSSQPQQNMMRLSFTMTPPALIEEGIKRLGGVVKNCLSLVKKQRAASAADTFCALV